LCAALGGMLAPALLYLGLARGGAVRAGWGIPTATDIAFAVGALALLGKRVPPALRVFLLALAILDDVGAVVVIAVGYSRGVAPLGLGIAALGVALVLTLRRFGVRRALGYLPAGALIWWGLWRAGVHPTLAGVVVGMLAPLPSLAATLHPWVAYGILPLFALVNCGVDLGAFSLGNPAARRVFIGVLVGLAVGKPLGIVGASALAVRLRLGALPRDVSWRGLGVAGCVAGIGFTMGILVAELSFEGGSRLAAAKAAVLASSLVGGVGGIALGRLLLHPPAENATSTKG
jgi:NhaA family Na+:H+ antiporter